MSTDNEESDFEGFEDQPPEETVDVNGILTNIFGDSDDNEEFEGFAETELTGSSDQPAIGEHIGGSAAVESRGKKHKKKSKSDDQSGTTPAIVPSSSSSSSGDEGVVDGNEKDADHNQHDFISDFDRIMEQKKEQQRRRKRRHDTSYLADTDDMIADIVRRMQEVAEEDRELIRMRQPAVKKLVMLPVVTDLLIKAYLRPAMIESGILKSIMEWLSPLPDNSLPNLKVRQELINHLLDFPPLDEDTLKESGIGKAVMYLRKHPKEIPAIKQNCMKLIDTWSRVIFNQKTDYMSLTREERIQRDKEHLDKRRKTGEVHSTRDLSRDLDSGERPLRPGDPGFISRARVPQPSNRDYLVRPEWKVKTPISSKSSGDVENPVLQKTKTFDRHFRGLKTRVSKKRNKTAGSLSLEGRKMAL